MNTNDYLEEIDFWPAGTRSSAYVLTFLISLALVLVSYALVVEQLMSRAYLAPTIVVLAFVQFVVQSTGFLHLSGKGVSKDRQVLFFTTGIVVGIIVVGSLWIMHSLAGRMMPSTAHMEQYMDAEGGF